MADPAIIASAIAAVPASAASIAAWVTARNTHKEVRTNHGKRQGEYVEDIALGFATHVVRDETNFAEVRSGQEILTAGQAALKAQLEELISRPDGRVES